MEVELPSPGMQDCAEAWQIGADESLVFGKKLQSLGRSPEHGFIRDPLVRADEITEVFGHRESDHKVRSWKVPVELFCEPFLCFVMLTVGAMPVATGTVDEVSLSATLALVEAHSVLA